MSSNPDELKRFVTGRWFIAVGWFLAAIAMALCLGALYVAMAASEDMPLIVRLGLMLVVGVLLAVAAFGVLISLGGERIEIDRQADEVRIARGLWMTWQRETQPLNGFHSVRCYRRISRMAGEHDAGRDYPVLLCGAGRELELAAPSRYTMARATAESLAKWLDLDYEDATERETVLRHPEDLDRSLVERLHAEGQQPQFRWPKSTRFQRSQWGDAVIIHLPRLTRWQLLEGVLSLLFLIVIYGGSAFGVVYGLTRAVNGGSLLSLWWLLGIAALPVIWILSFGVVFLAAREEVWISPRGVKRVWRLPLGSWTSRLGASEIEEIVDDGDRVILRSDRRRLKLGIMLPKAERKLLRQAVTYYLAGGEASGE